MVARGKSNSEQNGVDYDAESSDEEGGFGDRDGDGDGDNFEKRMRMRVREFEERRELEKIAEEYLQSENIEDGDEEITEEDKRIRVRKELEKV